MTKKLACLAVVGLGLVIQGCSAAGQVSSQQQQDKAAAIQKYVDAHKNDGPPREERGQ